MLQPADAILVLGRVDEYGHLTIDAYERTRHAAELYRNKHAPLIIAPARWSYRLTHTPPCTEATMLQARLEEWGVPASAIVREERSCDTLGAAYFSKRLFATPRNWKRLTVVTSEDHLERTQYLFEKVYGVSLEIQYSYGNRVLSEVAYQQSLEREQKSLKLMQDTWIGPIRPGNELDIEAVMEKHPGYNPAASMSAKEMDELVRQQSL